MLSTEFRQSDLDFSPTETLARHFDVQADSGYWEEVERDLLDHPEIWSHPSPEEFYG